MSKTNLPVLLLRGIVLLPNNDLRLEFDQEISKNIVDIAELFHDNKLLVINLENPLELMPDIDELPRIGVISKISNRIELPNGKTRIIISGLTRASIHEYLNVNKEAETLESIVSIIPDEQIDEKEEKVMIKKIYRELDIYIKSVPYMSNSILSFLLNINSLSTVTDVVAATLPISYQRLNEYLVEVLSSNRVEMLLSDIYNEKEIFDIERDLEIKVRQEIDNNQKEYILKEKIKKIKEELGEVSAKEDDVSNLKEKLDELDAPDNIKKRIKAELSRYETLSQMSPEVNIVRNYIDWLLSLPWNITTSDNDNLTDVKRKLDSSHYGLDDIKTRIIEYLAVKQQTNHLKSPILCLVGPPGVGKTSLAYSIAAAIDRNFVKIAVGGVNDEAEIIGHRRTYLGANPGRIIQSLKKAKSNNPVFLIDEIDKMTKDIKGDPASVLLEVLDPEQNEHFSDNYIEEEFDLSKIMFVTTANYMEQIPAALHDRLEIIRLSGYTEFEKLDIALKHLIPKICKTHGIDSKLVTFPNKTILEIIRFYTREAGVRELERQLSTIIRKIVTTMVIEKKDEIVQTINTNNLKKFLGNIKYQFNKIDEQYKIGISTGLAYTDFGGDTLPIEVTYYKGEGNLLLTGSLGDVMKESAQIALSYVKSNYKKYNIDYDIISSNDIHIHVPTGAVPKDGPSAGTALTSALVSALSNTKIDTLTAMTGEINLRGEVLAIGGLKEKSIAAHRAGIKKVLFPFENLNDLDDIPKEVKNNIEFIPVQKYDEVLKELIINK